MNCQLNPDNIRSLDLLPSVGIVIVSWNKKVDLLKLLDQIESLNYSAAAVVVVDNASDDGSADEVKSRHPKVTLIVNETNLGGTGGFNTGLDYCRVQGFDYMWLLDNDARITPDALIHLVRVAEGDPTIGVVGSKILNAEEPAYIVKLGATIDWPRGLVRSKSQNVRNFESASELNDVDYVPFCSALIRRSCFQATGRLDERFFLYWDDTDYCLRSKRHGYKTVVATNSIVYHPSFTEKSRDYSYYLIRNTFLFFAKHVKPIPQILSFINILNRFIKNLLFARLIGDAKGASVLFRGLTDFVCLRFGKYVPGASPYTEDFLQSLLSNNDLKGSSYLITFEGSADAMKLAFELLPKNTKQRITILIPYSRSDLYSDYHANIMILDDRVNNLFLEYIRVFLKIVTERFDTVVTTHRSMSPFAFAASRTYFFDFSSRAFRKVPISRGKLPLLILSILSSYLVTVIILPFFWGVGVFLFRQQCNVPITSVDRKF